MTRPQKPVVISCGEPAGIGPEIAYKAWQHLRTTDTVLWIGDPRHLPANAIYQTVDTASDAAKISPDALPVLAQDFGSPATPCIPTPSHAKGVINAIATAVDLVQTGVAAAVCTAPIHKAALIDGANFAYPGHTEYLAALAGTHRVVMMLASDMLRVVPTTIHIPLADVAGQLTARLLTDTVTITHAALRRDFGLAHPRIAVAGLNPHAGENGKMGHEDIDVIAPVLDALRTKGFDITGPLSADTMFHPAARARYDVAICMYHDQALIPIKTLDFSGGVNVTLGLPFVRTSPDHGTAFDIAGRDMADATSMIAALKMARTLSDRRNAP